MVSAASAGRPVAEPVMIVVNDREFVPGTDWVGPIMEDVGRISDEHGLQLVQMYCNQLVPLMDEPPIRRSRDYSEVWDRLTQTRFPQWNLRLVKRLKLFLAAERMLLQSWMSTHTGADARHHVLKLDKLDIAIDLMEEIVKNMTKLGTRWVSVFDRDEANLEVGWARIVGHANIFVYLHSLSNSTKLERHFTQALEWIQQSDKRPFGLRAEYIRDYWLWDKEDTEPLEFDHLFATYQRILGAWKANADDEGPTFAFEFDLRHKYYFRPGYVDRISPDSVVIQMLAVADVHIPDNNPPILCAIDSTDGATLQNWIGRPDVVAVRGRGAVRSLIRYDQQQYGEVAASYVHATVDGTDSHCLLQCIRLQTYLVRADGGKELVMLDVIVVHAHTADQEWLPLCDQLYQPDAVATVGSWTIQSRGMCERNYRTNAPSSILMLSLFGMAQPPPELQLMHVHLHSVATGQRNALYLSNWLHKRRHVASHNNDTLEVKVH